MTYSTPCIFRAEQCEETLRGNTEDKETWYMASEGPIGGLWWQNPTCLLIYVLSFRSLFLTLCASKGWKAHSWATLRYELRRSQSPHEYLICVAPITHFTSPFCPLVGVACMCVLMHVRVCLCCSASWSSRRVSQGRILRWSVQVCVLVQLLLLHPRTVNMVRSST